MLVRAGEAIARRRISDDGGSTLLSVLIIMLVLTIGGLALASIVVNTSSELASARGTAQSRAAADAGVADVASRAQRGEDVCSTAAYSSSTAPRYDVSVICDTSTVIVRSTGRGRDGGTTVTEAQYARAVTQKKLNGAVVSASGSLNVSSLNITAPAIDGDLVLNEGSFDCNNSMEIAGDLVVRSGSVSLSNACRIRGDLIVSGDVSIQNNAVGVDGDVYAMGNFTLSTAASIGGNVFTRGTATMTSGGKVAKSITSVGAASIDGSATTVGGSVWTGSTVNVNAATVTGSVTAAGTGDSKFYGAKTGGVRIAGKFGQLQATTVSGDAISTRAGASQSIAPDVRVTKNLTLAGTYTSSGSGPTIGGTASQNVAGLTPPAAPTVAKPWALTTDAFEWIDLAYNTAAWAGYSRITTPGCDFQGSWSASNVAVVNGLTAPTVIDARACATTNLYDVTFSLKTNVTFLVTKAAAQRIKINSADGAAHTFNIITPDATANKAPTCAAEAGYPTPSRIDIGDAVMADKISGIAYTPCTVHIGQSTGGGRWNGQVYGGVVEWGGNSSPRMQLDYREVTVPGFVTPNVGGGGAGGASLLGALVSVRDS